MVKEDKKKDYAKSIECDKCGSKNVYMLTDKTLVCRRCGYRKEENKQ